MNITRYTRETESDKRIFAYLRLLELKLNCQNQGGLATAFDLAAFRLSTIAQVKKSVSHPRTVASMRVMGSE